MNLVRAIELRLPAGRPWKARLSLYRRLLTERKVILEKFLKIVFDGKGKMEFIIGHA